jgi:hypothetical protein
LRQESIQIKNDRRCQQKRGYTSSLRSMLSGLTEVATSIASAVDEQGVTTKRFTNCIKPIVDRASATS